MNALFKSKFRKLAVKAAAFLFLLFLTAGLPATAQSDHSWLPARPSGAISSDRSGAVPTHPFLEFTLNADRGDVRVFNDADGEVRYRVTLQSVSASAAAIEQLQKFAFEARSTSRGVMLDGHFPASASASTVWATYEIHVPTRYSLHVVTRAGEVVTSDVNGRVVLITGGGNIQTGKIGDFLAGKNEPAARVPPGEILARIETGGGRIGIGDVAGSLLASSGGGHIVAGNVYGDATVQTRGGEIRTGRISGVARVSTGGGNVFMQSAEGLVAQTASGRVDLAEVSGPLQARRFAGGEELKMEAETTDAESAGMASKFQKMAPPLGSTALGEAGNDEDLPQAEIPAGPWDVPIHGPLWELTRRIENFWWGAVRVDSAEQQKRLLQAPAPEYPEAARRAGIEGQVTMLVRVGADGAVLDATLLYGEPILGRAAAHAIEQWRYAPLRIDGEPVNVLTSVTLAFELR